MRQRVTWAGTLALAALAVVVVLALRSARESRAQAALAEILAVFEPPFGPTSLLPSDLEAPSFATGIERSAPALRRFARLIEEHDGSEAAEVARVYLADLEARAGRFARAREIWQGLADGGDDELAAIAELNLIRLDRKEGRLEELASSLEIRIESQDSSLPVDVLLFELAHTLERLGRHEEVRRIKRFEEVVPEEGRVRR